MTSSRSISGVLGGCACWIMVSISASFIVLSVEGITVCLIVAAGGVVECCGILSS